MPLPRHYCPPSPWLSAGLTGSALPLCIQHCQNINLSIWLFWGTFARLAVGERGVTLFNEVAHDHIDDPTMATYCQLEPLFMNICEQGIMHKRKSTTEQN